MKSILNLAGESLGGTLLSFKIVGRIAHSTIICAPDAFRNDLSLDKGSDALDMFAEAAISDVGIQLTVSGNENIDPNLAAVYMSNHQSHMDVPVILKTCPARHLRMVAKKELFRVPVWGRAMLTGGMVRIDRSDSKKAVASLREAEKQFERGVSIWIAPEGTRSKDGRVGSLKKGGFYLAKNGGVPIIPMAINGTINILPKGTMAMARDMPVDVTYGDPIDTDDKTIDELMAEVAAFYDEHVRPL